MIQAHSVLGAKQDSVWKKVTGWERQKTQVELENQVQTSGKSLLALLGFLATEYVGNSYREPWALWFRCGC